MVGPPGSSSFLSVSQVHLSRWVRKQCRLNFASHGPLQAVLCAFPVWPKCNIIPLDQFNQDQLDLITGKEAPRAGLPPVTEMEARGGRGGELKLALVSWL